MAAPFKEGIDYFPLEVHLDVKIKLLMADCGVKGYGILLLLWQQIYATGYYIDWNDDIALLFASDISVPTDTVSFAEVKAVVNSCFARNLLDEGLYNKHGILTSKGIQKRYFEVVKRRKALNIKEEYLLIDMPEKIVNADNNSVNADNNSDFIDDNQQSKVKESKVNKSKSNQSKGEGEESGAAESTPPPFDDDKRLRSTKFHWSRDTVLLTEEQEEALLAKYDYDLIADYVDRLYKFVRNATGSVPNHYKLICKWIDEDMAI